MQEKNYCNIQSCYAWKVRIWLSKIAIAAFKIELFMLYLHKIIIILLDFY